MIIFFILFIIIFILSSSSSSHHHHLYHHHFHHQYFHHLHPIIISSSSHHFHNLHSIIIFIINFFIFIIIIIIFIIIFSIIILSSSRQTHLQIHTVRNFSWGIWLVHACAGTTCRWCSAVRTGGAAGGGAGILKRDTIYTMTETSSLNKQVEQVERDVLPQHSQSRAVAARLQGICLVAQPLQSRPRSYNRPTTMQASAQNPKNWPHTPRRNYIFQHICFLLHIIASVFIWICALFKHLHYDTNYKDLQWSNIWNRTGENAHLPDACRETTVEPDSVPDGNFISFKSFPRDFSLA